MSLTIDVTEADISKGKRWDSKQCAAAQAIRRQYNSTSVAVNRMEVTVDGACYQVTEEFIDFTRRFDRGESVNPQSFELEESYPCS